MKAPSKPRRVAWALAVAALSFSGAAMAKEREPSKASPSKDKALVVTVPATPPPAPVERKVLIESGGWEIKQSIYSCMATRTFDDQYFQLLQLGQRNLAGLGISGTAFKPYEGIAKERITVTIDGNPVALNMANVQPTQPEGHSAIFTRFVANEIPADLARPLTIAFAVDGKPVWERQIEIPVDAARTFKGCLEAIGPVMPE